MEQKNNKRSTKFLEKYSSNRMNASSNHKNIQNFFRCGNHFSLDKNNEKKLKAINKKDKNQYLISFHNRLARFTPQGLEVKEGKLTNPYGMALSFHIG